MSQFALSDSFEFLYYGCTTIVNIATLTVRQRGLTLDVRICRLQLRVKHQPYYFCES